MRIVDRVSTRFHDRAASLAPIVELIAAQFAERPGNYLAFFSSFDYLEQVAELFAASHPEIPLWRQARRMEESARHDFLAQFTPQSRGIGFAVLGGVFGEGIDLPGERLIGAFIATLGLPQVNPVNEQIKARMGALFGAGYDYTYFYPGVQKVVQAAGRVIRTQSGPRHRLSHRRPLRAAGGAAAAAGVVGGGNLAGMRAKSSAADKAQERGILPSGWERPDAPALLAYRRREFFPPAVAPKWCALYVPSVRRHGSGLRAGRCP